jgi:NAD+ synthase (glutamine-hydrolysing)
MKTARNFKAPMVYVNMVGGQDEIIFDGGSFAIDEKGQTLAQSRFFDEDINFVDLKTREGGMLEDPILKHTPTGKFTSHSIDRLRRALVLGIKDYARKTGFERIHLGLSGGIDSAVVACLAVEALGADQVTCVTMPGPFSEAKSRKLAEQLAKNLGVRCLNLPIGEGYGSVLETLKSTFGDFPFGLVNENLQARLRGLMLMSLSNQEKSLLLTTGNKCEYATGYSTLYGDMCGGLAPIGDVLKGEVYALARLYNEQQELIPLEIIERAPSAELRPNQKDQDSLPPYDDLDRSVRRLVELKLPAKSRTDKWLVNILLRTEFKRWQSAPVLKVTGHSFGRGRRMPIAHSYKE